MKNAHLQPQSFVFLLWLSLFGAGVEAGAGENYLLFPVTTDLQRRLVSSNVIANAYAVIYANGVIANGRVNGVASNIDKLRTHLKELANQSEGAIYVALRFEDWTPTPKAENELAETMKRLCQEAGFEKAWIGRMHTGGGWREIKNAFQEAPGLSGAKETSLGGKDVRVYPVRTGLSRYLTTNADCYVDVRQPFDGRQAELPPKVRRSISQFVDKLGLDKRKRIQFHVSSTTAGAPDVNRFSAVAAVRFARQMGFESASVSHSPNGGAPENLLGKAPPAFVLDGLDGKPIRLIDQIRGKVAIITFWGLACGPCRQEAPHLSATFETYQDQGLCVIAVNAYDDPKHAVADHVQQEQLRHLVALKGRRVARDYAVGAFPTSFWVDHRGKVVDYVVGFAPGDESQLTLKIEQLLKNRRASAR